MKIALALPLFLATSAFAWSEPTDVRGVPWGATQAETRARLERGGDSVLCDASDFCNLAKANFGSVGVSIAYFFPKDGKFEMAAVTFRPADYAALLRVFTDRYGQPVSSGEAPFRVAACVTATNHSAQWEGERVLIDLRQYASNKEGRATIMLKAVRDREVAAAPEVPEEPELMVHR